MTTTLPSNNIPSPAQFNGASSNYSRHVLAPFIPLALAIIITLLSPLIVRPFEHFPVNDEWVYGYPVQQMLETGRFQMPGTVAFALTPIFSALPFCMMFGDSYTVLRMVGVLYGVLACAAMFLLCREIGLKRWNAGLFALCISCNPYFINLSNSFMTDVPSFALSLLMFVFIARGCKDKGNLNWIVASLFFVLTVATRQSTLIYIAGILFLLICRAIQRKKVLLPSILLVILPIVSYLVLERLVESVNMNPHSISRFFDGGGLFQSLSQFIETVTYSLSYLGLLCMPLLIPMAIGSLTKGKLGPIFRNCTVAFFLSALPLFYIVFCQKKLMPFTPNLFSPPFLGAYSLCGNWTKVPIGNWILNPLFTVLSSILAFILVSMILQFCHWIWHLASISSKNSLKTSQRESKIQIASFLFGSFIACLGITVFLVSKNNLDRYYVAVWPMLLGMLSLCFTHVCPKRFSILVIPLAMLSAVLGIIECADCHTFNRTKEMCIRFLEKRGARPMEIDGGPEYNYVSNMDLIHARTNPQDLKHPMQHFPGPRPLRWWVISGERYIISKEQPISDYKVINSFHYWSPLLCRRVNLYMQEHI